MSSILLATLLSLVQTNGTVAPAFQRTTVCNINTSEVTTSTTGPALDFPYTLHKKVKFSSEIPNDAVLKSLIFEAAQFPTDIHPSPVGGPMTFYKANLPGSHKVLELKGLTGLGVFQENHSPSAKKLVRFINMNCKTAVIQ